MSKTSLSPVRVDLHGPAVVYRPSDGPIPPIPRNAEFDLMRAIGALKKYWRFSASLTVLVVIAVAIATLLMTPMYEPTARLEIDPPGSETFSLQTTLGAIDTDYLQTQAQILRSDDLATDVVRLLHLEKNPIIVSNKRNKGNRGILSRMLSPFYKQRDVQQRPARRPEGEKEALDYVQQSLTVSTIKDTRVVEVKFASPDPDLSAQVTNALVDVYVRQNYQTRYEAVMQASDWLSRQLEDIRQRMLASNTALADYQKTYQIADIDDKQSTAAQALGEMNRQFTQAQADRIQLEAYTEQLRAGKAESLPQIRDNSTILGLTQRLGEAREELSQATAIYGKNNPNVEKLQTRVDELGRQLATQTSKIISELETNYAVARNRQSLLSREKKNATDEMYRLTQYANLKREAQTNAELYNSLYMRVKESAIAAAAKSSNIRVFDRAQVLDHPSRPHRMRNIALGLVIGILGGIIGAFLKESIDTTIYTPADLDASGKFASISLVPRVASLNGHHVNRLRLLRPPQTLGSSAKTNGSVWSCLGEPFSPATEAILELQTSVMLASAINNPRTLLIVSPFPGEGKTTIAVNLAIALARHGSTCLVDADLRHPRIAGAFDIRCERGLGDILTRSAPVESCFSGDSHVPNLTLLPGGTSQRNPAELLPSKRMRALIRVLRRTSEYIVIDSPPMIPYADARALAPIVDGIILVGRSGSTTREGLARCTELLAAAGTPVLAFVLNAVDQRVPDYYR